MLKAKKHYLDTLPEYLSTMSEKGKPTIWLPKQKALEIQRFKGYQNDRHYLMTDVDKDVDPNKIYPIQPNIVTYNIVNGNHQAFWLLKDPVYCQPNAKAHKAYRYLRAIESAYDEQFDCDKHFARHIHKNPCHWLNDTDWQHNNSHSLTELAEVVNLTPKRYSKGEKLITTKNSRNCTLFDDLRFWAYKQPCRQLSYDEWYKVVVNRASALNGFSEPMRVSDVLTVAKSVSEFVYYRYKQVGTIEITPEYRQRQAIKGAIGGKKSKGGGRPSKSTDLATAKPWESLGISRATWYRKYK